MLDTAFTIFNNLPPRMVIKEMKMHTARDEATFQAATPDECFKALQRPGAQSFMLLSSATESLCKDTMSDELCSYLADLGTLNLFFMAHALNSLIFQYQNSLGWEGQLVPINNALGNWKAAWKQYAEHFAMRSHHSTNETTILEPRNMWKRIGFSRHASEYWLLVKLIHDRISAEIQTGATRADTADESAKAILDRYDETSMRQVNDLIAEFQKTTIED